MPSKYGKDEAADQLFDGSSAALVASERPASIARSFAGGSSGIAAVGRGDESQLRGATQESGEPDSGGHRWSDSDCCCMGKETQDSPWDGHFRLDCEALPARR
jgi:hypothetical protein